MKLTLTLDEVSACAMALLSKAQEAEEEALGCEKLRCASAAEFWQKRANLYRKTFEALKAQRASWWEKAEAIMSIQFTPDTPATRRAFNRLAREKMKLRLLADIRMDLMVCELEGWDKLEYLDELLALVQELRKKGGGER